MSILTDALPVTVTIGGREIPINADFRASVEYSTLLLEGKMEKSDLIARAFNIYYGERWSTLSGTHFQEAVDQLLWFYRCGKAEKKGADIGKVKVSFSYEHDAGYLYSSFLDQYGVDLQKVGFLHWWQFKAMFDALSDDQKIMEIIKIRAIDLDKKMSAEQKAYYRRMKKIYALPRPGKSEREKKLEEILMNGGDLSKIDDGED